MTREAEERIESILCVGKSLRDIGINDYALTPAQTTHALDQAEQIQDLVVLGGHVLVFDGERFDFTGDNWYVPDSVPRADLQAYRKESFRRARSYIEAYPSRRPIYYRLSLADFDDFRRILAEEAAEEEYLRQIEKRN